MQGERASVLHTFYSSARSLSFHSITYEQLHFYLADRQIQNALTDSSVCQLHAKCNPRPSLRFANRKV